MVRVQIQCAISLPIHVVVKQSFVRGFAELCGSRIRVTCVYEGRKIKLGSQ